MQLWIDLVCWLVLSSRNTNTLEEVMYYCQARTWICPERLLNMYDSWKNMSDFYFGLFIPNTSRDTTRHVTPVWRYLSFWRDKVPCPFPYFLDRCWSDILITWLFHQPCGQGSITLFLKTKIKNYRSKTMKAFTWAPLMHIEPFLCLASHFVALLATMCVLEMIIDDGNH